MTKKKLHILFLNSWYPSHVFPQNGDFIQRHAEAVAIKHKVTAIHVVTDKTIQKNLITDSNINGVRTIITYLKHVNSKINKQIQFYKAYKKLIRLSESFDIIHVNRIYPVGVIALWFKIFHSIPYIISEHFTGYLQPTSNQLSKIEIFFSKAITKQASYVCPVSQDLAENMQNLGFKGNYYPIANVVNTNIFKPVKENQNKNSLTLMHISSLNNDHKNISGILNVIAKLQHHIPEFTFYLIGEQVMRYQNYVKSLNINTENIQLIDQIPHHQVVSFMRKSDVLLSFSNYENLPCVILEAFACGTKVISTNVGGIKEYFPKNFGELIPVKDEDQLLKSILKIQNAQASVSKTEIHQYAIDNFSCEII